MTFLRVFRRRIGGGERIDKWYFQASMTLFITLASIEKVSVIIVRMLVRQWKENQAWFQCWGGIDEIHFEMEIFDFSGKSCSRVQRNRGAYVSSDTNISILKLELK